MAAGDLNGDGHLDLAVPNFSNGVSTLTLLYGTGTGKFNPGGTVATGNKPLSVAIGEFNADGHPDLASVSGGYGHLNVNLSNGDGTFAGPVNYATGFCASTVTAADFNHDQVLDLAVSCALSSHEGVSILLGNKDALGHGDGTFGAFTDYGEDGQSPVSLAVADVNGDGDLDLVTANGGDANNSVGVMLGNPDGTFGRAALFVANQAPQGAAVGDFNGDGWADVATAGTFNPVGVTMDFGNVAVLFGNGDGTLAAPRTLPSGIDPSATVIADFTGDGKPDVAVAINDVQFQGATVFPNAGDGTFGAGLRTAASSSPTGLGTADFNHDGKPDLAVLTGSGVSIFLGNGDAGATFAAPVSYAVAGTPTWVAVADFNNDGWADLVVADNTKNTQTGAHVLLGNGGGTFAGADRRDRRGAGQPPDDRRLQPGRQGRPGGD